MEFKKFEKWTIETAQMKHSSRRNSMSMVAQRYITHLAAEYSIENYQDFLRDMGASPEKYDTLPDKEREFYDIVSGIGAWAAIAGCVKPYIQLEEWLKFGDATIEGLSLAAMEINPHWFEQPDQEKKTNEPPPESMNE